MRPSKAIIIGSTVIEACVLGHLGYAIYRDRAVAETARHERDQQAKTVAENYMRAQSKEAWRTALKHVDVEFESWLKTQVKSDKNQVSSQEAVVKPFDLSDIQWDDAHNVTVHGIIGTAVNDASGPLFTWSRKVELKDDGVDTWWLAIRPAVFELSTLTREQYDHRYAGASGPGGRDSLWQDETGAAPKRLRSE